MKLNDEEKAILAGEQGWVRQQAIRQQIEVADNLGLTKDFERLDFMRMDVEGHESKVIEGSHKTIEHLRPSLFFFFLPNWR